MKLIPLTQGKFAIVDDEDFDWLNQWKWCAHKDRNTYYAVRTIGKQSNRKMFRMHRQIMNAQNGQEIDHCNQNGLNNCRVNLRFCTNAQNQGHSNVKYGGSSKYKGVHWHKRHQKWAARIGGERACLGFYKSEKEAALAYDQAARKRFGEFAIPNFS